MRKVEQLTNTKFLNLKKVSYPENSVGCYFFAERLGVDSVAFICKDKVSGKILLNDEYKPPIDDFILGSFGGSIDKEKSIVEIVQDEVLEEAGFNVDKEDVEYLGRVFVSTQMNQFCHLFIVFVDANLQDERHPENPVEAMAGTKWVKESDYLDLTDIQDWKVIAIMAKYNARKGKS